MVPTFEQIQQFQTVLQRCTWMRHHPIGSMRFFQLGNPWPGWIKLCWL
uniref:Uncharacterized protein n=1 Tax=Rhizophora mucronata TaxID=61149 RepID=A0A2P2PCV6_RHIMU